MTRFRRLFGGAAVVTLVLGPTLPTPAAASHVSCGQVITSSTTLDADLVCPDGNGLVIQGNGVVLNLNGHTVRGHLETRTVSQPAAFGDNGVLGAPYTVRFAPGQFAGIRIRGNRNAVVGPGTVEEFAAGIVIEGGASNSVTNVTVQRNLGPPGTDDLGDGIMVLHSTGNVLSGNTIRDNGPFDGVVLLGGSGRNIVRSNRIVDNRQPEICPEFDLFRFSVSGGGIVHVCGPTHPNQKPYTFINQQNHGVKFEGLGPVAPHANTIEGNRIENNGNTGVFVPSTCPDFGPGAQCPGEQIRDNVIRGNQINRNGFGWPAGLNSARLFEGTGNGGSGITMMTGGPKPPIRTLVTGNMVNRNAKNGIAVLAHRPGNPVTMSTITFNMAIGNNVLPFGGPAFNGQDGNAIVNPDAPCDSNVWSGNYFGSSLAHIGGPVPPNNLTNHPCVGPVL